MSPPKQTVYIDLPGEPHQVWAGTETTVILRKARDVVIGLTLGKAATYTVEATSDWFYDEKLKKRLQKTTFKDGERCHLMVSRYFKGSLLVKGTDGKVIQRIAPSVLDPKKYGPEPEIKPDPIIIVAEPQKKNGSKPTTAYIPNPNGSYPAVVVDKTRVAHQALPPMMDATSGNASSAGVGWQPNPSGAYPAAVYQEEGEDVYFVDIKDMNDLPAKVADWFAHGGSDSVVDSNDFKTRNWMVNQFVANGLVIADRAPLLRELIGIAVYISKSQKGAFLILKGRPGIRQIFTAARYGLANEKAIRLTRGAGSFEGTLKSASGAFKDTYTKPLGWVAIIVVSSLDYAEWMNEHSQIDHKTGKPQKDIADLIIKLGIDLAKLGIGAALAEVACGVIFGAVLATGVALPAVAIVVGTIVITALVFTAIDWVDNKTGFSEKLPHGLKDVWDYLCESYKKVEEYYREYPSDFFFIQ